MIESIILEHRDKKVEIKIIMMKGNFIIAETTKVFNTEIVKKSTKKRSPRSMIDKGSTKKTEAKNSQAKIRIVTKNMNCLTSASIVSIKNIFMVVPLM